MKLFRCFVRKCVCMNRKLSTGVMIHHNLGGNNERLETTKKIMPYTIILKKL